jgi:hypothetical protein
LGYRSCFNCGRYDICYMAIEFNKSIFPKFGGLDGRGHTKLNEVISEYCSQYEMMGKNTTTNTIKMDSIEETEMDNIGEGDNML